MNETFNPVKTANDLLEHMPKHIEATFEQPLTDSTAFIYELTRIGPIVLRALLDRDAMQMESLEQAWKRADQAERDVQILRLALETNQKLLVAAVNAMGIIADTHEFLAKLKAMAEHPAHQPLDPQGG